ncbi:hypothetical protein PsorP6_011250 [Peronosclerospora sorghi]|uniref:Uncharacterized protein n=1 Tax=Peronosclerospora sorghi TaxID=230839 RepID=A0ACC0WJQ0_9STRA|nr:hypothetical protein PsorP6_011250 [Peronosclerospora sorghi]
MYGPQRDKKWRQTWQSTTKSHQETSGKKRTFQQRNVQAQRKMRAEDLWSNVRPRDAATWQPSNDAGWGDVHRTGTMIHKPVINDTVCRITREALKVHVVPVGVFEIRLDFKLSPTNVHSSSPNFMHVPVGIVEVDSSIPYGLEVVEVFQTMSPQWRLGC